MARESLLAERCAAQPKKNALAPKNGQCVYEVVAVSAKNPFVLPMPRNKRIALLFKTHIFFE